jgi:hypothetical protein
MENYKQRFFSGCPHISELKHDTDAIVMVCRLPFLHIFISQKYVLSLSAKFLQEMSNNETCLNVTIFRLLFLRRTQFNTGGHARDVLSTGHCLLKCSENIPVRVEEEVFF